MKLKTFSTPGEVDDVGVARRAEWSAIVQEMFKKQLRGHAQFFSPLGVELGPAPATRVMRWGAFPRKLATRPQPARWTLAEDRDAQEEYCEWVAVRDRQGRIVRVNFTSEPREYYRFLAKAAPDVLLKLYKKHVSKDVKLPDLFSGAKYDDANRWNRAGAMHMIQGFNTLEAAVTLVAQATVQRTRGGTVLVNARDLIQCGIGADPDRNSDPLIVTDVNALARSKVKVTLADPVGLYIDRLRTGGWVAPDGTDPAKFWKVTRGTAATAVRATFEVPVTKGYTVGDIRINGVPITSPSQLAEFIDVRVVGLAAFKSTARPKPCAGGGGLAASAGAASLTLEDVSTGVKASRG